MIEYKRYAFISYNHKDVKWAKWLHRKLEGYKLPSEIHNEFEDTHYLRPVFRDQEDLNTGILKHELREKLETSKFLIVICSSNAACSAWVSQEVQVFIELGRIDHIIPFVIEESPDKGTPQAYIPETLRTHIMTHPDDELLGVNIQEVGKEKAFIRVVSKMLEVDFDVLWKRNERVRRNRIIATSSIVPIVVLVIYWFAIPVELTITLIDEKHHLPPLKEAILSIADNEYHIHSLDTTIYLRSLPGYMRGSEIVYKITAPNRYDTLNGRIELTKGVVQEEIIQMKRNKEFAVHSGQVFNDLLMPLSGVIISIEDHRDTTDGNGYYAIEFPLQHQSCSKCLIATHKDYMDCVLESYPTPCSFILHKLNSK